MLRFPLFGVPVSVHWTFLLVALFGMGVYSGIEIGAWTAAVFVAVLLHESGHAFTARAFGASPVAITLFALGGVTTWSASKDLGPGRRFVVSAAGSAVGIAAGVVVIVLARRGLFDGLPDLAFVFLQSFVWAGLVWGILNWIPILPLDGGHMLQHGLEIFTPKRAAGIARVVSIIAGVIVIGIALYFGEMFLAIFVAMITFMGMRSGQQAKPKPRPLQPQPEPPTEQPPNQEPPAFPI
ncbi:MAG: site-2 protease family protein [Actinomycetota bacterium]